jgi:two-component system, OmpR family, phosphate regulon sensor histidine kinase PhoR
MADLPVEVKRIIEHNIELENYFRNTIIPQLYVDGGFILRKFTPPAMKQFNLSAADLGKPFSELSDNIRFPALIENIQLVLASGDILEKEIQTTDYRWYQMNIIPYITEKRESNGVIITFVEITRRINDLKEQEKLNAEHETLLDTISHDIKNPLTSLMLAVEQFKTVAVENSGEFLQLLSLVERSLNKMQTIIYELTDTRKQQYKYRSTEELLNFEHIIEDVRLTLQDDIISTGAVFKYKIGVSQLMFSRRKLRTIIFNLLSNAIKYKAPDRLPEISIETNSENGYISIAIKDNGMGIHTSKQEVVFSKYYRVENAIEGSGIGLYLVKEIVRQSGGKLLLESELGKGTLVTVYLKEK